MSHIVGAKLLFNVCQTVLSLPFFSEIHLNKLEQIIYFSNKLLVATIQLEINSFLSFLRNKLKKISLKMVITRTGLKNE